MVERGRGIAENSVTKFENRMIIFSDVKNSQQFPLLLKRKGRDEFVVNRSS